MIYLEAIISMYSPEYCFLHEVIKSIRKISCARIDYCQRSLRLSSFYSGEHQNIFDMTLCAGTLMDLGVYCVYGAVDLFGVPNRVISKAHYFDNGCDKSAVSVFEYDDFSAVLTYSKTGDSKVHTEIIGENVVVTVSSISKYIGIKAIIGDVVKSACETYECESVMKNWIDVFAEFIRGENLELYRNNSLTTEFVHKCMDDIKASAKIEYKRTR